MASVQSHRQDREREANPQGAAETKEIESRPMKKSERVDTRMMANEEVEIERKGGVCKTDDRSFSHNLRLYPY